MQVYQLATIEGDFDRGTVPKVRSVVHRGFITPSSKTGPLLLTSTDIRTPKVSQLVHDSSGGIERAWWFPTTQEQLRISGAMNILPSPKFKLSESSAAMDGAEPLEDEQKEEIEFAAKEAFDEFEGWADGLDLDDDEEDEERNLDWEEERRKMFESMSEHMRASWVRPVPGTRLVSKGAEAWPEKLPKLSEAEAGGDEHTKTLVRKAFKNFALVAIEPDRIDYVELGVVPNRRTIFEQDEDEDKSWIEHAVVP